VICPEGNYCSGGSDTPTVCPAGSFTTIKGLRTVGECNLCTEGLYCAGTGNVADGTPCTAGNVCERGESTATGLLATTLCPAGYYCPEGTLHQIPCPPGTY